MPQVLSQPTTTPKPEKEYTRVTFDEFEERFLVVKRRLGLLQSVAVIVADAEVAKNVSSSASLYADGCAALLEDVKVNPQTKNPRQLADEIEEINSIESDLHVTLTAPGGAR